MQVVPVDAIRQDRKNLQTPFSHVEKKIKKTKQNRTYTMYSDVDRIYFN
jgi:hypothetical protein